MQVWYNTSFAEVTTFPVASFECKHTTFQKEEHKRMYADIRSRVREKCEKLFEHLSMSDKVIWHL